MIDLEHTPDSPELPAPRTRTVLKQGSHGRRWDDENELGLLHEPIIYHSRTRTKGPQPIIIQLINFLA